MVGGSCQNYFRIADDPSSTATHLKTLNYENAAIFAIHSLALSVSPPRREDTSLHHRRLDRILV